ncbi:hypothetical protein SEA_MAGRITTE_152 [Microbacterium phage Magritte]|nr:hypothetical protein SEA_MAGRITTE_152 [Microbacterium phage Magritte]
MSTSPAQQKLIEQARDLAAAGGVHGLLVSGSQYRTAAALEKRGLGTLSYQGPGARGWFRAEPETQQAMDREAMVPLTEALLAALQDGERADLTFTSRGRAWILTMAPAG